MFYEAHTNTLLWLIVYWVLHLAHHCSLHEVDPRKISARQDGNCPRNIREIQSWHNMFGPHSDLDMDEESVAPQNCFRTADVSDLVFVSL